MCLFNIIALGTRLRKIIFQVRCPLQKLFPFDRIQSSVNSPCGNIWKLISLHQTLFMITAQKHPIALHDCFFFKSKTSCNREISTETNRNTQTNWFFSPKILLPLSVFNLESASRIFQLSSQLNPQIIITITTARPSTYNLLCLHAGLPSFFPNFSNAAVINANV